MDGFMGYDPLTVMLAILLLVIVSMIIYSQYSAPAPKPKQDETGRVNVGADEQMAELED